MHTRVIGIGNPLRGDDGIGPAVAEMLKHERLPNTVEVIDGGEAGLGLVGLMEDAARVVLVDAAKMGIEPGALRLPILLKKYIKQNAKLVAFNVDPLFNNSVDGLMYIKIADLPESTVKPVMEEFQAELERKFMENSDDKTDV